MSRRVHDVPFVIGSDGSVFVNVLHCFADTPTLCALLKRARRESGRALVAVALDAREVRAVMGRLRHGVFEAAAFTAGARNRRRRGTR